MANLTFPQLSSGAQVQYPIRKRRLLQSPVNSFADGSMIASNLNADSRIIWDLSYSELDAVDQMALQDLFIQSKGPFLPFVFIDPTDNMLSYSTNLTIGNWLTDALLSIAPGTTDPTGGSNAFLLTNASQIDQQISQTVAAPANLHYVFSVYASSSSSTSLSLERSSGSSITEAFTISQNWKRLVSSGRLSDSGSSFQVSISVPAGQTVAVFGPQLEPQISPSTYRPTSVSGGVYQNAHFLGDSITFQSDAPGLFSTLISIETT